NTITGETAIGPLNDDKHRVIARDDIRSAVNGKRQESKRKTLMAQAGKVEIFLNLATTTWFDNTGRTVTIYGERYTGKDIRRSRTNERRTVKHERALMMRYKKSQIRSLSQTKLTAKMGLYRKPK